MRRGFLILAIVGVVGCGAPEQPGSTGVTAERDASMAETGTEDAAVVAGSTGGPCAALDASPVRYDAAGKPVAYTFEYPSGWDVNELFASGATSLDITKNLDEQAYPEFVLRFGHVVDKPLDKPMNLVETWRKLPMVEEVAEIDVEGRTMYVAKTRIGEMVGFQALFPDVTSKTNAWMVSGGVVDVPKGCEEAGVAAVERIIRSFAPNRDIGPPPAR